jgi:hypothetical protein
VDPLTYKLLWVFGWAVFFLFSWSLRGLRRERELGRIHAERMAGIEKGIPLPELPAYDDAAEQSALAAARRALLNPRWPLGVGAIGILGGLGVCLAFALSGEADDRRIWSYGLIGIFVGFGFVLHYFLTRTPRA